MRPLSGVDTVAIVPQLSALSVVHDKHPARLANDLLSRSAGQHLSEAVDVELGPHSL
jgi:hypothetical protein